MAEVGKLEMRLSVEGGASAALSARLVLDVLVAAGGVPEGLVERFPDFFDAEGSGAVTQLRLDAGNLFGTEPIDDAALRAGKFILKPSERYLELVAAVARDRDVPVNLDLHGWPILSLVSADSANVAEAAGESILGGGAAA
jgi:hypothetical protein